MSFASVMKIGFLVGSIFLVNACNHQVEKSKKETSMKKKNVLRKDFNLLEDLSEKKHSVSNIHVEYEVEQSQTFTQGGLVFNLIFTNKDTSNHLILNPLDYLFITLQNEEGWPLNLPVGTPNSRRIKARTSVEVVRPYQVQSLIKINQQKSLLDSVKNEQILLRAKSSYKYSILIDKLQKLDKKNPTARTLENRKIRKGKYKIKFRVSIFLAKKNNVHNTCESDFLEIELK